MGIASLHPSYELLAVTLLLDSPGFTRFVQARQRRGPMVEPTQHSEGAITPFYRIDETTFA